MITCEQFAEGIAYAQLEKFWQMCARNYGELERVTSVSNIIVASDSEP